MRVAVQGCSHGDLDEIYASVAHIEQQENTTVDLVISCGDFQAIRNQGDFDSIAVPDKYKELGSFHKYYSGEKVAPYPTLFIGGNHEASNYLWELYYGGWVAPNMYYMGCSGVVRFGGLRIGGLSGIFDGRNYRLGHFEFPPYDRGSLRSVYHVREFEVRKLLHLRDKLDVFLSHDWPRGVANCGCCNKAGLLRCKPYFREEIARDELGSPAAAKLCNRLKPRYWFSAHYHVKFPAVIRHGRSVSEDTLAVSSGNGGMPSGWMTKEVQQKLRESGGADQEEYTKFLALDKCMPNREFLQILDFPEAQGPKAFQYDVEWLAILRRLQAEMPMERRQVASPTDAASCPGASREEVDWVSIKLSAASGGDLSVPTAFVRTAPTQTEYESAPRHFRNDVHYVNPQTASLLELLELPYTLDANRRQQQGMRGPGRQPPPAGNFMVPTNVFLNFQAAASQDEANPEEINIEGDQDDLNDEEIDISM
ncbi:lariat debranching enzyme [Chloropicon primus]|uniref:Lariat debranching enzyme n=2 Tax=Chloropicon primus TaxID=1764295 RepID=A0A5B8MF14_9CHLO|nr:lariat debranching enzyme [Chloropicon primus]UPQ98205.1 lariat debranching enzyme [Chloropicon primus]|eukprot:QDZ18997.1 lariat debranching enzyme [Chloropicon primus]